MRILIFIVSSVLAISLVDYTIRSLLVSKMASFPVSSLSSLPVAHSSTVPPLTRPRRNSGNSSNNTSTGTPTASISNNTSNSINSKGLIVSEFKSFKNELIQQKHSTSTNNTINSTDTDVEDI